MRTLTLVLGLFGLLALLVLVLRGIDPRSRLGSGPLGRLLSAGLTLLALATGSCAGTPVEARTCPEPAAPLRGTAEWKRISGAWGKRAGMDRGSWKPSERQKEALQRELYAAARDVDALVKTKKLSDLGGEALKQELYAMASNLVPPKPPPPGATCYEPMPPPEHMAYGRLNGRLPLLEKMVKARKLQPAVVCRVLDGMERELKGFEEMIAFAPESDRPRFRQLRDKVRATLKRLRSR